MKPHETLAKIAIFHSLDAKEIAALDRRCMWRHARAKAWLLEQDDTGTDIYFLTSGALRVLITPSPDREVILADINAGGYFGEMAAIDGQPRSAGNLAITDATIACMPALVFREILHKHPKVSEHLLNISSPEYGHLINGSMNSALWTSNTEFTLSCLGDRELTQPTIAGQSSLRRRCIRILPPA